MTEPERRSVFYAPGLAVKSLGFNCHKLRFGFPPRLRSGCHLPQNISKYNQKFTMFKAVGVNEYGQVYYSNGLLEKFSKNTESSIREFEQIEDAIEYAKKFINIYPHVRFQIFEGDSLTSEISNEEYWQWKESKDKEWVKVNREGIKLQSIFLNVFLSIIGVLVAVIAHFTSEIPILFKLVVFPLVTVFGWHFITRAFAHVC